MLIAATFASCQKPAANITPTATAGDQPELEKRLAAICDRTQGSVSVAVTHIETGRTASVNAKASLRLYSVFKLPVAIAVLKEVEANRLKIDQLVHVTPEDIVPGAPENTALWQKPVDRTIAELIEVMIARSDNTSTDKLVRLIGGPKRVTDEMRALGFNNINVYFSRVDLPDARQNPNTGSAEDIVNLLVQLQKGKILQPAQTKLLIDYMQRTTTGPKRLRGDLPEGIVVAHKTGSGERDPKNNVPKSTNDVGLITLPNGLGNLAIAVLISDSKLPDTAQEKVIAELARAAYDSFVNGN